MEKICHASRCTNVIHGRRADARYCGEPCKQFAKEERKLNGGASISAPARRHRVKPTGNLIDDAALSATLGLMSNGTDPVKSITTNVMDTCVPYAIETVRKRPIVSLIAAVGGFKLASNVFKSCTTTITKGDDDKDDVSTACAPASAIHKTGGAAAAILSVNYLLDQFLALYDANYTGNTRVLPVSNTPVEGSFDTSIGDIFDIKLTKAN